jgi:hypothetical protein
VYEIVALVLLERNRVVNPWAVGIDIVVAAVR